KLTVGPQNSLREVMSIIDSSAMGIALVIDEEEILLGTVTDGDIRRAILRGLSLETAVIDVMKHSFTSVGPEASSKEVLMLMHTRSIKQIPVLASDGHVLGLHVLPDLVGHCEERSNWAVVMAGGEGRRLRPLTKNTP